MATKTCEISGCRCLFSEFVFLPLHRSYFCVHWLTQEHIATANKSGENQHESLLNRNVMCDAKWMVACDGKNISPENSVLVDNSLRVSTRRVSLRSGFSIPRNRQHGHESENILWNSERDRFCFTFTHHLTYTWDSDMQWDGTKCTGPNKINCLPSCGNRKFFRRFLSYENSMFIFLLRKSMCVKLFIRSLVSVSVITSPFPNCFCFHRSNC